MAQTILQIVQEFCGKKTLPVPSAVVGNTELSVTQIRYLLAEVIREEMVDGGWQQQKIRKTWVSTATEDQGALTTLIGPDYNGLIPATMWDISQKLPVLGPIGDESWQNLKAFVGTGPLYQYRIEGDHLKILPILPAGHTMSVYYVTGFGVLSSGGTAQASILADTDTPLLPESIIHRSLDYRWKRAKGEPWDNDYAEFQDLKSMELTGNASMPVLSLDGVKPQGQRPGIWVPNGNWNIH